MPLIYIYCLTIVNKLQCGMMCLHVCVFLVIGLLQILIIFSMNLVFDVPCPYTTTPQPSTVTPKSTTSTPSTTTTTKPFSTFTPASTTLADCALDYGYTVFALSFLNYSNPSDFKSTGIRCDSRKLVNDNSTNFCDLVFETCISSIGSR